MKRWELINFIIQKKGFERYLEVGTATYNCFDKIKCQKKTGCDPADKTHQHSENAMIYGVTSDNFFRDNTQMFQLVFIDGLHHYDQVARDIVNSWNSLDLGGFIIMHDCIPFNADAAGRSPISPMAAWNGDCYKAIIWFHDTFPDLLCRVLSDDCGMGFIHKNQDIQLPTDYKNLFSYMDLDFEWLNKNWDKLQIESINWGLNYAASYNQ